MHYTSQFFKIVTIFVYLELFVIQMCLYTFEMPSSIANSQASSYFIQESSILVNTCTCY